MDEMIASAVTDGENESFITDVMRTIENDKTRTAVKNWCGRKIEIRKTIGLMDMQALIDRVVDGCFNEDGEYTAAMKTFMLKYSIVSWYTDVPIPTDVALASAFLYETNLFDIVKAVIDPGQLQEITAAVDSQLKYRLDMKLDVAQVAMIRMRDSMAELGRLFDSLSEDDIQTVVKAIGQAEQPVQ